MFRRPTISFVVLLVCLLGAGLAWHRLTRKPAVRSPQSAAPAVAVVVQPAAPPAPVLLPGRDAATNNSAAAQHARVAPYRLSNTRTPLNQLLRSDSAVLLENARLDTTQPPAQIPEHLRARGDAGTYIVQSRGPVDDAFRARLHAAGATLVSYIPNNAWLVRVSGSQAQWLASLPEVRAAIPFEPYYKVKSSLLPLAVEQTPLPAGTSLNVVMFADAREDTLKSLETLGARVVGEGPSPFGPVVTVQPESRSLVAIASLPGVQIIERAAIRVKANDLTRVKLGVTLDTTNTANYYGLSGSNVLVNVTDSGVDVTHPDLVGRVLADTALAAIDTVGHGTHVAGIIAGSGAASATVSNTPPGSVTNASFRGKAPGATLFSVLLGDSPVTDLSFDAYAQEQIARTNALISNNSWRLDSFDYDIFAASYDAAVRDALPGQPGSQPVLFVFAAGNEGNGNDDGLSGEADSIGSPGTGKNVITVGALEQFRNITNKVVIDGVTNAVWEGVTDSDDEVAFYSSRGNVGIGVEGDYGRFKPDVVAPGTFVVSAQSAQWDQGGYYSITNHLENQFINQILAPNGLNQYSIFVPPNAVGLQITVTPDPDTTNFATALPIYVREGATPTLADFIRTNFVNIPPDLALTPGADYFYAVGNPTNKEVHYDVETVLIVTNDLGDYYRVLKELNDALGPDYRYESGTSMAAPAVSGILALIQEFFEQRVGRTNSPALMKALLINGARSVSLNYNLQVTNTVNHQGWGLANLPTSLPNETNGLTAASALQVFDQSPTNALVTGQEHTRLVTVGEAARTRPIRFTLVWTDPPGNPAAGVKLVNNLDLVVTNLDSGRIYYGNDITGGDFNSPGPTNGALPNVDAVNNVENIFIHDPLGTNYSVTVVGRRVNVNAVTAHPDGVAQDYALVISSGNGENTNAFTVVEAPITTSDMPLLTVVTNALSPLPLFNQTVGANSPLIAGVNGVTNQWHYYVVTNTGTNANFTNAAFITFQPPTLAVPRMGVRAASESEASRPEADIDMYVSTDATLTNLNPVALAAADRSVGRGGTEIVSYTDSAPGIVYYIGIKSEDQMAGQYAFFSAISDVPFSQRDSEGNLIVRGIPARITIPDGTPDRPGAALVFGIATEPITARRVVVTNTVTHENHGDLLGNLSHGNDFSVLNNHTFGNGFPTQTRIYDDSGENNVPGSQRTDGPGSLRNFTGKEGIGLWLLAMIDDGPGHTGRGENLTIKIEPEKLGEENLILTIEAFSWGYATIDVPPEATNLTVCLAHLSATPLPLDLYLRRGDFPTFTDFDKKATINPPGGCLSINKGDIPPLQAGTYYIGVFNPNAIAQTIRLSATIDRDLAGLTPLVYTSVNKVPLLDDAVTFDQIDVTENRRIITTEVGVRLNHPRVSDLALTLISPSGTRDLLFENRGGLTTGGLGSDIAATNVFSAATNGLAAADTNVVDTLATAGTLRINYNFYGIPDTLVVYYESAIIYGPVTNSGSGQIDIPYGPGASTLVTIIVNEGNNTNALTAWDYTVTAAPAGFIHATFTENTNRRPELLKFASPPFTVFLSNVVVWSDGFEQGITNATPVAGTYFAGGWLVDAGDVDLLMNGTFGLTPDTGNFCLDINGTISGTISTNVVTTPGSTYTLAYAFTRNPDGTNGSPPQASILIDGAPVGVVAPVLPNDWTNLNWQHSSVVFVAAGTNTLITLRSDTGTPYGVMFDTLVLSELREVNGVYLPEESLTAFKGEKANGRWTLEIWDSRVGAPSPVPVPELLEWNLSFILETEVPPHAVIEPFVPLTNTVPAGGWFYLLVDVPAWATAATNSLLSSDQPLFVWFNQNSAPTGAVPDLNLFGAAPVTTGVYTIVTNGAPPLIPGTRYYIGLQNTNAAPATFIYRVDFDITALTNAVAYTDVMQGSGIPRYFSYEVSTNASAVQFDLFGMDGNLNLIASQGAPLPTLFNYDLGSFNAGTSDEQILVFTNGAPIALAPGTWYLGVMNSTTNPVNFSIMATELTTAFPTIVTLTNAVPYGVVSNTAAPGVGDYYRYTVTSNAARVQFEIFGASGDFTLVAHKGLPLPDLGTFDYLSANPGLNDELIVITTNSAPVTLTSGDWFITAVKMTAGTADYSIMATEWAATGQPIVLVGFNAGGGDFCITWASLPGAHYIVQSTPTLGPPVWTNASPTITAFDITTTWCTPMVGPMSFFQVIEGIAIDSSLGGVTISSIAFTPGGIVLTWYGPTTASFQVEWTDSLAAPVVWNPVAAPVVSALLDGVFTFTDDGTQTAPLGPLRFYRINQLP
jgi:subtilisin family serine protease/subtilisin-like proprotein convertase family protein